MEKNHVLHLIVDHDCDCVMLVLLPTHLKANVSAEDPVHPGLEDSGFRIHPDNVVDGVDLRDQAVVGDDALNVGVLLDCTVPHLVPEIF